MRETIYDIVNNAIDLAFIEEKYEFDFYSYLKSSNITRKDILSFLESSLGRSIIDQIEELDMYLRDKDGEKILKESYDWMSKKRVGEFKIFLNKIIEHARDYEQSKRPGRKPKTSNK